MLHLVHQKSGKVTPDPFTRMGPDTWIVRSKPVRVIWVGTLCLPVFSTCRLHALVVSEKLYWQVTVCMN